MPKSKPALKRKFSASVAATLTVARPVGSPPAPASGCKPRWDRELHRLWLGEMLVKHFRRPAPMADLILSAFEEEEWDERIDDPLPPLIGGHEGNRLRNQIHALNRRLDRRLIRFYLDGTGQGICWEAVPLVVEK